MIVADSVYGWQAWPSVSESPFEFSIASWNVHLGVHNNGGRNDVVGRCRDLDADVLVLQESWWYDEPDSPFAPRCCFGIGLPVARARG